METGEFSEELCSPQELEHSAWRIGQSVVIKN